MTAYMVVIGNDLSVGPIPPGIGGLAIQLVPARKTAKWRGRRFNIRTVRASGLALAGSSTPPAGPYTYTRSYRVA